MQHTWSCYVTKGLSWVCIEEVATWWWSKGVMIGWTGGHISMGHRFHPKYLLVVKKSQYKKWLECVTSYVLVYGCCFLVELTVVHGRLYINKPSKFLTRIFESKFRQLNIVLWAELKQQAVFVRRCLFLFTWLLSPCNGETPLSVNTPFPVNFLQPTVTEDFAHLPPEQRRKRLQQKLEDICKELQKEVDQRCVHFCIRGY